jgi:hypothetical protein
MIGSLTIDVPVNILYFTSYKQLRFKAPLVHYQSVTRNKNGSWLVIHIYTYVVFFVVLKKTDAFNYHV